MQPGNSTPVIMRCAPIGSSVDKQLTGSIKSSAVSGDTMDLALIREYGPGANKRWSAEIESVVRVITPDRGDARIYRIRKRDDRGGENSSLPLRTS